MRIGRYNPAKESRIMLKNSSQNTLKNTSKSLAFTLLVTLCGLSSHTWAHDCEQPHPAEQSNSPTSKLLELKQQWAHAKYHTKRNDQKTAYKNTILDAEKLTSLHPDSAEAWVWQGIIKASSASIKKGISALITIKEARADLEKGLSMSPESSASFGNAVLGAIYHQVPKKPLGFKDTKKAQAYFDKALKQAPNSLDSNFLYAEYLLTIKEKEKAKTHLEIALKAPQRANLTLADTGRKNEAQQLLLEISE